MPKAEPLTPAALATPQITPKAATPARGARARSARVVAEPEKVDHIPLQVRIPREDARAIKVAAVQADQTISEFMLSCFHAYMRGKGRA